MHLDPERLVEQLDEMVEAGRFTEDEAERLRAAAQSGDLHEVVREIRFEHARARLDGAVEEGRLTQEEADAVLEGLENGELPHFLWEHQRGSRHGAFFPGRGPGLGHS